MCLSPTQDARYDLGIDALVLNGDPNFNLSSTVLEVLAPPYDHQQVATTNDTMAVLNY